MTKLLYMDDSYLKEFRAEVLKVLDNKVILNQTAFYPRGGGLPNDTGYLITSDGLRLTVSNVLKDKVTGEVIHVVEGGKLKPGMRVTGIIDWDKRYKIMRAHTGLHVLIAVINKMTNALVTGNQIGLERSRVDVNLERPDRQLILKAFDEANEIITHNIPVKIYYMPKDEAMKIPGIIKLLKALPPKINVLRIVEIPGVDIQADGGPHVSNVREIGELIFLKLENKGRNNRRIYFTLRP